MSVFASHLLMQMPPHVEIGRRNELTSHGWPHEAFKAHDAAHQRHCLRQGSSPMEATMFQDPPVSAPASSAGVPSMSATTSASSSCSSPHPSTTSRLAYCLQQGQHSHFNAICKQLMQQPPSIDHIMDCVLSATGAAQRLQCHMQATHAEAPICRPHHGLPTACNRSSTDTPMTSASTSCRSAYLSMDHITACVLPASWQCLR